MPRPIWINAKEVDVQISEVSPRPGLPSSPVGPQPSPRPPVPLPPSRLSRPLFSLPSRLQRAARNAPPTVLSCHEWSRPAQQGKKKERCCPKWRRSEAGWGMGRPGQTARNSQLSRVCSSALPRWGPHPRLFLFFALTRFWCVRRRYPGYEAPSTIMVGRNRQEPLQNPIGSSDHQFGKAQGWPPRMLGSILSAAARTMSAVH